MYSFDNLLGYNLNDALKKDEDYQLLQVIGRNLCGDNEDVDVDISFYISLITNVPPLIYYLLASI